MSSFSENLRILVKSSDPRYLAIRFVLGHVFFRYFSYLGSIPHPSKSGKIRFKGSCCQKEYCHPGADWHPGWGEPDSHPFYQCLFLIFFIFRN